ncbi:MAG: MFS transporter [Alphaproteobacteria bacterium]
MFGGFGRALSSPHYRLYACGHIANVFGWWGNRLGIGWLTWQLTESAAWLGIVAFAGMIPVTLISPIAGVLADRIGHRQMAMAAGVAGGSVTLTLALLTMAGLTTVPVLLALSILQGVAFGTEFPARQALIPQLTARENMSAALAFNATTFQVGTFLGPVLAGLLITHYGTGASIGLYAMTNFWMALMILLIRFRPAPRDPQENNGFFSEIVAGFRYIAATPSLRLLFMISFTSGLLLRPYTELLPGFSDEVFGRGPEGLAALTAAAGFGALAAGLLLVFRGRARGLVRIMLGGALAGSVALALFSTTGTLTSGVAVLAVASFLLLGCHVGAYSLIQNATDNEMRGRVISVNVSISIGGPALGALMIGWLAELVGLQMAVGISAMAALVIVLALLPSIRRTTDEMEAE